MKVIKRHSIGQQRLPLQIWGLLCALALLALLSPNPGIGFVGVLIATAAALILWRPAEPQVLLFIVGFQWLQAFAPVLLALYEGQTIGQIMGGPAFETATLLSLIGIGVFALGLKVMTRRTPLIDHQRLIDGLFSLNRNRLFLAWVALSAFSVILGIAGRLIPGLSQAFIAIEVWKWAAVLLLFFRWLATSEGAMAAAFVLLAEAAIGMMGYFSAFKEVFFILLLAGTGIFAIGRRRTTTLTLIGIALMSFLGFWQAIKNPYREFLSQGERAQVVRVSIPERIDWLSNAIFIVDKDDLANGLEDGLKRLGYVEFFGHCIQTVPLQISHTNGQLWKEAVMHPLMPRMLFPSKPVINDSDRTSAYTGMTVAGADLGTSISIGYMGESYIDFGPVGMFIPIFLWGMLIGWCFNYLRSRAPHPLLGVALAACLLLSTVLLLETSNIKMTGSFIAGFIVTAVLLHFFGTFVWLWLTAKPSPQQARRRKVVKA